MDTVTADVREPVNENRSHKIIHAYASMPHYRRHVEAVFKYLHPSIKGKMFGSENKTKDLPEGIFLVASFSDAELLSKRSVIYLEHGAGQSYKGDYKSSQSPYYHGGKHPNNIIGYVCPNEKVATSWQRPAIAAGCPALDPWHQSLKEIQTRSLKPAITFTFHWDCRVAPESRWAFPHYANNMLQIADHLKKLGFDVFGHAHPKAEKIVKKFWHSIGVKYLDTPDMVFWSSDILVADNTSLLMEFASLGRPVVFLNAPWYRKNVNHEGRFWEWNKIGANIENPEELIQFDFDTYLQEDSFKSQREMLIPQVYSHTDGTAGTRAAKWVTEQVLKV